MYKGDWVPAPTLPDRSSINIEITGTKPWI